MKTYRRRLGNDTWHWCRNCSNWPVSGYVEQESAGRPTTGELCNHCKAKEKAGNCMGEHIRKSGGGKKLWKGKRKHPRPRKRLFRARR